MSFLTTYIDTNEFGSLKVTMDRNKMSPMIERPKMSTIAVLRNFVGKDIDEFRAKYGKDEGEAKFFHDYEHDEIIIRKDNLFMFNGASALWQYALAQGTSTANTALPTPTYLTNANTYLYVGDGNYTSNALSGTVSVTNGSGSITFGTSQSSSIINQNCVFSIDSTSQVYTIASGSGTSFTISPVFGGSTASGLTCYTITPANHTQTALSATTNIASQIADSTFPSNPSSAQFNAITGATNVTNVVLTVSGADVSANDIVNVVEVLGNLGANGTYVANPASASSITLQGAVGTGTYTSGTGYVTKRNVITSQSTFGPSAAVFTWYEWGLFNGNSTNKIMFNRRVVGLGSKAMGTSSALKIGISIS